MKQLEQTTDSSLMPHFSISLSGNGKQQQPSQNTQFKDVLQSFIKSSTSKVNSQKKKILGLKI